MTDEERGISPLNKTPTLYQRGTNYFLGIGIDTYQSVHKLLFNCVRDVTDIKNILVEKYDFEEDNTLLLCNDEATREGILDALEAMYGRLKENDSLIFMYSGHGTNLNNRNIGFLIPFDGDKQSKYINLSEIKSHIDTFNAKHIFVIFDSCFSGLILTQRDTRIHNVPENYPSRFALTSGRNSPVSDGTGKNSPFAAALLDELKNNDDSVGAIFLSQKILDTFRQTGKDNDQLPDFGRINDDTKFQGQYYFYPKNYELSLARERTKRLEAEEARQLAEQALITAEQEKQKADASRIEAEKAKRKAQRFLILAIMLLAFATFLSYNLKKQKDLSEKAKRAAENLALFSYYRTIDPTIAYNILTYNLKHHPSDAPSQSNYYQILADTNAIFYDDVLQPENPIKSACFTPDGQKMIINCFHPNDYFRPPTQSKQQGGFQPHAVLVETKTKEPLMIFDFKPGDDNVVFSPDGENFLTYGTFGQLKTWHINNPNAIKEFKTTENNLDAACYIGKTGYIASGYSSGVVRIWDTKNQSLVRILNHNTNHAIKCMTASADGQLLATGGTDGMIKIWEPLSGRLLRQIKAHKTAILDMDFSFDKALIVSGGSDNVAHIWSVSSGTLLKDLIGHTKLVRHVGFLKNSYRCVSAGTDGKVILHRFGEGHLPEIIANEPYIMEFALSPAENKFITIANYAAKVWTFSGRSQFSSKQFSINSVSISDDRKYVATYDGGWVFKIWDTQNEQLLITGSTRESDIHEKRMTLGNSELDNILSNSILGNGELSILPIRRSCFLHNKNVLALSNYGVVRFYDINEKKFTHLFKGHNGDIQSLAISNDNHLLLTGGEDSTAILWDINKGLKIRQFAGFHKGGITSVKFYQNNKQVLTAGYDGHVALWHIDSIAPIDSLIIPDARDFMTVDITPDGKTVIIGSKANLLLLYKMDNKKDTTSVWGNFGTVWSSAISENGQYAIIGTSSGMTFIIDLIKMEIIAQAHVKQGSTVINVKIINDKYYSLKKKWNGAIELIDFEKSRKIDDTYKYQIEFLRSIGVKLEKEDLLNLYNQGVELNAEELNLINKVPRNKK